MTGFSLKNWISFSLESPPSFATAETPFSGSAPKFLRAGFGYLSSPESEKLSSSLRQTILSRLAPAVRSPSLVSRSRSSSFWGSDLEIEEVFRSKSWLVLWE